MSAGAALFYAVSYPLGSLAVSHVSPFTLITARFAVTAALLWSWLLLRRGSADRSGPWLPRGAQLAWCIVAGLLVQGVQFLGLYWALARGVAPGVCALMIAMNPVVTAVLARLLLGASESRWGYVALALATGGVLAACVPKLLDDSRLGAGVVATVIAVLGLAGGSMIQERRATAVSPIAFTAIGTTVSIPLAALLALTEKTQLQNPPQAVLLTCLLVITSALGTGLYASCVRRVGARRASMLFAVIPAVAALASWAIQGTEIGPLTILGLALGSLACLVQIKGSEPAMPTGRGCEPEMHDTCATWPLPRPGSMSGEHAGHAARDGKGLGT